MAMDNDSRYLTNIADYLSNRAVRASNMAKAGLTDLAILSETFYCDFLNILLDCHFINENVESPRFPGVDLIDWTKRVAAQVSVTCSPKRIREKIQSSIDKYNIPKDSNWHFYFVPLTIEAPSVKKDFVLKERLSFNPKKDILDIARILQLAQTEPEDAPHIIDKLKKLSDVVDKYKGEEPVAIEPQDKWITAYFAPVSRHHVPFLNEEELVEELLSSSNYAISGAIGGIGKTELLRVLCAEVVKRNEAEYIGWIDYSGNISADLLRSVRNEIISRNDPVNSFLAFAQKQRDNLVLFIDNARIDQKADLMSFLACLGCRVYVSTRNQAFLDYDILQLDLLPEPNAEALFIKYRGSSNNQIDINRSVTTIVKRCGCHPFAIELVAKYGKAKHIANDTLIEDLSAHGFDLNAMIQSNWNGNKQELIEHQLDKLFSFCDIPSDEKTKHILQFFAIIPSYPHTEKNLNCLLKSADADFSNLQPLLDSGWLSLTDAGCYMHDLVKTVVIRHLSIKANDCTAFLDGLAILSTEYSNFYTIKQALPLLLSVADFFSSERKCNAVYKIFNDISSVYFQLTEYTHSIKWAKKVIRLLGRDGCELDDEKTFILGLAYNNKGSALFGQAEFNHFKEKLPQKQITAVLENFDNAKYCMISLLHSSIFPPDTINRKLLVIKHNMARLFLNTGQEEKAVDVINNICNEKIQMIMEDLDYLYCRYSLLEDDPKLKERKEFLSEKSFLEKLISVFSHYTSIHISDVEKVRDYLQVSYNSSIRDIYFVFNNEMIPSLLRSFGLFGAAVALSVNNTVFNGNTIPAALVALARNRINFALDICDLRENVSLDEADIWGVSAQLIVSLSRMMTIGNAAEAAARDQKRGIDILEILFQNSSDDAYKLPLIHAYENMYSYTKNEIWKRKASAMLNQ